MITAIEMRMRTEVAIEKYDDLEKIIGQCKKVADNGGIAAYYHDRISKGSMKKLQQLGYIVTETDNQRDGYTATISW